MDSLDQLFSLPDIDDHALEDPRLPDAPIRHTVRGLRREMIDKQKKNTLAEILDRLPEQGESHHIITHGKFDFFDILPRVIELGNMTKATVRGTTWCMNRRCALELLEMIDDCRIQSLSLITGLYLKRREQSVFATLANGLRERGHRLLAMECHAKIITIEDHASQTKITIEGSANFTSNPRIEQTAVINDDRLHDFHGQWIDDAIRRANQP
jgi:hypothetical protein